VAVDQLFAFVQWCDRKGGWATAVSASSDSQKRKSFDQMVLHIVMQVGGPKGDDLDLQALDKAFSSLGASFALLNTF